MTKLNKDLMRNSAEHIASQIISSRSTDGERTACGFAENLLQEGRKIFPNLNMNMINYCIRKMKTRRVTVADALPMIITERSQNSELSSLTMEHHPINAGAIALLSLSSNLGSTVATECTSGTDVVQNNPLLLDQRVQLTVLL
jgi:hypothetical protein